MRSIYLLFFLTTLLLICSNLSAQKVVNSSHDEPLPWVKGNLPSQKSGSFHYKVVQGEGKSLSEAKQNALQQLIFEMGSEEGSRIKAETTYEIEEKIKAKEENIKSSFQNKIIIDQDEFKATFGKVDEYYELLEDSEGIRYYRCWQIYAIGNSSKYSIPKLHYTTNYGFDSGFRSFIVPGWGQLYKDDILKGVGFLASEILLTSGLIYANNRYQYNINRSVETNSLSVRKEYVKRADDWSTIKNISIAAMAGVWLWNVVDAIATDGPPRYALKNTKLSYALSSSKATKYELVLTYRF